MRLSTAVPAALVSLSASLSAAVMLTLALAAKLMFSSPHLQRLSPRLLAVLPAALAVLLLTRRQPLERLMRGWAKYRQGFQQYRFAPAAELRAAALATGQQPGGSGSLVRAVGQVTSAASGREAPNQADLETPIAEVLTEEAGEGSSGLGIADQSETGQSGADAGVTDGMLDLPPDESSSGEAVPSASPPGQQSSSQKARRPRHSRFQDVDTGTPGTGVRPAACLTIRRVHASPQTALSRPLRPVMLHTALLQACRLQRLPPWQCAV